ncbi:MAG: GUN4 domain-containing protein [Cyanobacteria bacterium J06638_28]
MANPRRRIAERKGKELELPTSFVNIDYEPLFKHLIAGGWEQADAVTYDSMLSLAELTEGWMPRQELAGLPASDLMIIDRLWRLCSGNRFGFSVQAKLYHELDQNSLYKGCEEIVEYQHYYHHRNSLEKVEETFAALVGWKSRQYRDRHSSHTGKWTFQRHEKVPCDLNAPVGHLPSTFKLGSGKNEKLTDGGDSYGSLWVDEYTYYEWSENSFVDSDFLREFYRYFNDW